MMCLGKVHVRIEKGGKRGEKTENNFVSSSYMVGEKKKKFSICLIALSFCP